MTRLTFSGNRPVRAVLRRYEKRLLSGAPRRRAIFVVRGAAAADAKCALGARKCGMRRKVVSRSSGAKSDLRVGGYSRILASAAPSIYVRTSGRPSCLHQQGFYQRGAQAGAYTTRVFSPWLRAAIAP